jgi:translation initiation factor IF-1
VSPGPKAQVDGVIDSSLPKALYRVRLASGEVVTASVATEARRVIIKFLPGDPVSVEISPFDPSRGRILTRR